MRGGLDERHARQASRQAKRRQAAALQNGLGVDARCERYGSNRGQQRMQGHLSCRADSPVFGVP
jgi:hypothetical protein